MRYYIKKTAAIGFLVFLGLWMVGAIRGITLPYPPPAPSVLSLGGERETYISNGNWANNLKHIGLIETPLPLVLDNPNVEKIRIIEKTATVTAGSISFEADDALIRAAIKDQQAEVFMEKKSGIEPARRLTLEIGVHPDQFDTLVEKLRTIGSLASYSVEQKDRTNEFRKLNAQRQALKRYQESILKLRVGNNPSIDDSLKLEQKIQDVEKELQSLGVQLGDLLGKESFYHIHLTLAEYQPGDRRDHTYTTPQRIFHALLWAIVWWSAVALAAGIAITTGVSFWTLRQTQK